MRAKATLVAFREDAIMAGEEDDQQRDMNWGQADTSVSTVMDPSLPSESKGGDLQQPW